MFTACWYVALAARRNSIHLYVIMIIIIIIIISFICFIHLYRAGLAVEEVGRHEELEGDLRGDWELGNLSGAVGEPRLVGEVHTDLHYHD